jgi:acetyl esterase
MRPTLISTISALAVILISSSTGFSKKAGNPIPDESNVQRETKVYKSIGDVALKMFIYKPSDWKAADRRPAIVFFFGGGWKSGSLKQFDKQATYFATRGIVAMAADYRVKSRHGVGPQQCVTDAKSAIRWVRANAAKLGVDSNRIVASGGSAGGHLAAAVGTIQGFEEKSESHSISSKPNAVVCFNPALDTTRDGWGDIERGKGVEQKFGGPEKAKALSPHHSIRNGIPPTLILHGEKDQTVPFAQAVAFTKAMKAAGNRCELAGYKDQKHGFFNFSRSGNKMFAATVLRTDQFLSSLGYIEDKPTIKK